jgi:tRNA dimethylallyltransferase
MDAIGVALVGTSASGKSEIALRVAKRLGNVEIISVDSMAVYREMDLATAKPSLQERQEVPHHMVDILDPSQECTVSLFKEHADIAVRDVTRRGNIPLLVGGTGLYHRAVIDNLSIPPQFLEVREQLDVELNLPGGEEILRARLGELDPTALSRIEPGNVRRLLRALEVTQGSGRPFSSFGPGLEHYEASAMIQIGLDVDAVDLDSAIEGRVDSWIDRGLEAEVRGLAVRPEGLSRTARQAIGYREFLELVDGNLEAQEARDLTVARTRALVRRQKSWFRRDPRVRWYGGKTGAEEGLEDTLVGLSRVMG